MNVRQATIEDLDRIAPLFDDYRQFYGQASDPDAARSFLQDRFRHRQSVIFIAEEHGLALGFTQLYPSFSSMRLGCSYILNDLFVAPAARRGGVGVLLLQAAARFGRSEGAVRLSLSTALDNQAAQALYESQGWQADQVFRHYSLPL
jgi:ribosomal protein S18 acetylase RimI-like enzyme